MLISCTAREHSKIFLSCENPADHLFDRDFLNVYVAHGQLIEKGFAYGNHPISFDLQLNGAGFLFDNFAVFAELFGGAIRPAFTLNRNQLEIGETVQNVAEPSIEENCAMVNDDDAFAKFLDVRHVMTREQDRSLMFR